MKNSKIGFTLAEVLVTLGIIGVVAAMTVPTLMSNHQTKVYVTTVQKVYAEITQALEKKVSDENAVSLSEAHLLGHEGEFLKSYFKYVKDCGNTKTPCFADSYKNMNGRTLLNRPTDDSVVLANGATIGIYVDDYSTVFHVDTNGPAKPNVYGKDFHIIHLDSQGNLSSGSTVWYLAQHGWVMDEGYVDYFRSDT